MNSEFSLIDREECSTPGADDIFAKLPGRVRDIATLRGLGYTCMEIGRRFGITPQAVSATLTRHHRRMGDFDARQDMLELSSRAVNALSRIGVNSRVDALKLDVFVLLHRERNCGEKTLEEIRIWLARANEQAPK